MAIKQDMICQTYVTTEVSYLVDSVRNLGYVTDQMYTTFLRKLEATNQVYDVELIHYKRVVDPILEENTVVWNECNYYCTYTSDILNQLYMGTNDVDDDGSVNCYKMNQGDYFTMKVHNKNKTFAVRLQEFFLHRNLTAEQIMVVYGGAIRDEAY